MSVEKSNQVIDQIHLGAVLGESQLLMSQPSPVSLICQGEVKVLTWSRYAIYGFLAHNHHFSAGFMWGLSQMTYHKSLHIQQQYQMAQDILRQNALSGTLDTRHHWALYPSILPVQVGEALVPKFITDLKDSTLNMFHLSVSDLIKQGEQWSDEHYDQDVFTETKNA